MRVRRLLLAITVACGLMACGGGDKAATTTTVAITTSTPTSTTTMSDEHLAVTTDALAATACVALQRAGDNDAEADRVVGELVKFWGPFDAPRRTMARSLFLQGFAQRCPDLIVTLGKAQHRVGDL